MPLDLLNLQAVLAGMDSSMEELIALLEREGLVEGKKRMNPKGKEESTGQKDNRLPQAGKVHVTQGGPTEKWSWW